MTSARRRRRDVVALRRRDDDRRAQRAVPRRRPARPTCSRSRSTTSSCPAGRQPDQGGRGPGHAGRARAIRPTLLGDVVVCPAVAAARRPSAACPPTTSSRCSSSTACCTCSTTTTPSRARGATMRRREQELLARFRERHEPRHRAGPRTDRRHERHRLVVVIVVVVVLFVVSVVLALAETAFTRMSRIRAAGARRGGRQARAERLLRLLEHPEQTLNSVLLLAARLPDDRRPRCSASLLEPTLGAVGVVDRHRARDRRVLRVRRGRAEDVRGPAHRARRAARSRRCSWFVTNFPPLRVLSRGFIGLANVVLPGKGLQGGPVRHRGGDPHDGRRRRRRGGRSRPRSASSSTRSSSSATPSCAR